MKIIIRLNKIVYNYIGIILAILVIIQLKLQLQ